MDAQSIAISEAASHGLSKVVRASERSPVELTSHGTHVGTVLSPAAIAAFDVAAVAVGLTSWDVVLADAQQRMIDDVSAAARERLGMEGVERQPSVATPLSPAVDSLPLADAAARGLSRLLREGSYRAVEITVHGSPAAVIVPAAVMARIHEVLHARGEDALERAFDQAAERQTFTSLADVARDLGVDDGPGGD